MKKSDPTGSGQTIEIPVTKVMGAVFPYWGYWAAIFSSAIKKVKLNGASYQNHQDVTEAITNLIDGPGRIFLADKLWEIGETINLNSGIAMNGLNANLNGLVQHIGTIPQDSNDNGHLYIGTMVFDKPMQELWGSVSLNADSHTATEDNRKDIETALNELYELQLTLQTLLQSMPEDTVIATQTSNVNILANDLANFIQIQDQLRNQIIQIEEELETLTNLETNARQLSNQKHTTGSLLNERLNRLSTANTANRAAIHAEAMDIQAEYRNASNRLHTVEIALSRLRSLGNGDSIGGMRELLISRSNDVQSANANHNIAETTLTAMQNAFNNGQAEAIELSAAIKSKTETIETLQVASESISVGTNLNDIDLIKIFAAHLDGVQSELEELLFMALRLNKDELLAISDTAIISEDAADVADYSSYLTALSDVDDAFTDDEYTLLRHIADFGYSRSYIPGPSRVYALVGMGPTDRRRAFRTLIEEILTLGKSLETDSILDRNSPLFTLKLALKRKDNDLREMSQLIDFLTERRPNINWGE